MEKRGHCWFARDVTAAILEVKNKAFSSSGNLTLFSCKFVKKILCCIDLQHGRLVTWLQTKNWGGLLDKFC